MKAVLLCVLSASLSMTLLTLIYLLLLPALEKRYAPKGLYAASVVLMIGFLIPYALLMPKPLMSVSLPVQLSQPVVSIPEPSPEILPAVETLAAPEPVRPVATGGAMTMSVNRSIDWLSLLGWVWLAGASGFLCFHLIQHLLFTRTLRRWRLRCANTDYDAVMKAELDATGIRQPIRLYICPGVSSPMLTGVAKPAIYLPDESLALDELSLVIRHELTHYRRRDLLVKAALMFCRAVHWFNPVMLPLSRWFCYCQEASCDSHVTQNASAEERRFYSETIIRVIRRQARVRTHFCTSFYGGKNGMKRRILSIMNDSNRRAGLALCLCLMALTLMLGSALALEPEQPDIQPTAAWVHAQSGTGTVLLGGPTANDLRCPMGIYLNGTPVVIQQVVESSSHPDWNHQEGEPNWAHVLIGGDGYQNGISGWMPLRDLVYECADALPTATLKGENGTGHIRLYTLNDRESVPQAIRPDGTEIRVLGQLNHWLHVSLEDTGTFVLYDSVALSKEADQLLYDLLPERFSGTTRQEYDSDHIFQQMFAEKAALYNHLPVEYWTVEDKAWFGQLEETFMGTHDHYYMMPDGDDLSQEKAIELALKIYAEHTQQEGVTLEDVDVYPGFYCYGVTQTPLFWDVLITSKGDLTTLAWVTLSSPDGGLVGITLSNPEEPIPYSLPYTVEGNG